VGVAAAEFLVATAEGALEFMLQSAQAAQFAADFSKLFAQTALDGRARLEAAVFEFEKAANFGQGETEILDAANEGESFEMSFVVAAEAARGSPRKGQEAAAFVEANGVNAEAKLFRDVADVHRRCSQSRGYTLEYSPESRGGRGGKNVDVRPYFCNYRNSGLEGHRHGDGHQGGEAKGAKAGKGFPAPPAAQRRAPRKRANANRSEQP